MADSEIVTIIVGFHLGAHKTFKHYYNQIVVMHSDLFPHLVSYNSFVELQQRVFIVFALLLKIKMGRCTGISFIDSTTLKVCRNQRNHLHKVFRGLAERGKSSMGWFYGFKLHLVCNERGELLSFYLTRGNVYDRNIRHIKVLCEKFFEKISADNRYISQVLW
jgi:hypothetical protein